MHTLTRVYVYVYEGIRLAAGALEGGKIGNSPPPPAGMTGVRDDDDDVTAAPLDDSSVRSMCIRYIYRATRARGLYF